MIVFPNRPMVFCDVDETLVMWTTPGKDDPNAVEITCPASTYMVDGEEWNSTEWTQRCTIHTAHVERLIKHANRGHLVIVWSAGGADWAEAVVKSLGIEKYVTATMKKPDWYMDDLTAAEFMGDRIYEELK